MDDPVTIYIDDQPVRARPGEYLLWAALDAGIYIPHLCAMRERGFPFGACRLCFVEVEGRDAPVTACSEPVRRGLRVRTRSERVDRLRRTAFELLMSHHDLDCKNCVANRSCELQRLAKFFKIPLKPRRLRKLATEMPVDDSHPEIVLNPNRCVLCGKCVWVCQHVLKTGALDFVLRGLQTRVAPFRMEPLAQTICTGCAACADVCPVGALRRRPKPEAAPGAREASAAGM